MKNRVLIFFIVIVSLTISCKKETNEVPDSVSFTFFVLDDQNIRLNGAVVYLYDNEQTYLNALNGNKAGFIDSLQSNSGGRNLILAPDKDYWVIIQYHDVLRNLDLNNFGISSKINKIEKGTNITVNFNISPFVGFISFWTNSNSNLPIVVKVSPNDSLQMDQPLPSAPPTFGNLGAANFILPEGNYHYLAYSKSNGCLWDGTFSVKRGVYESIQLQPCLRGRVVFYSSNFNSTHGPIDVVLNLNDTVGVVKGTGSYSPINYSSSKLGFGSNFITTTREPNTFTYIAKSYDNFCVWADKFTISSDTTIVINLTGCP
jgi:hypothetical protein